ncbi:7 transmembrane sweet-taste receptor of 3 GCPR-domain-containing protein [Entophlyctis helioformis]|nr:7 transmembrane sweet-taste receptor of 3 GCPR-domain-containing protein [Entophlyctis helioformis]
MFNFPDVFTPTGKVNLDPSTGDPTSSYNIFSIQGDQKQFVPVAQWDAQTRQVTITRTILFGTDESTVTPADDIVVADYTAIVRLRGGLGASAIALNLIAMLLITATAAFFAVHRHNPIIRKSSIPNMHMMLVGLLLPCFDVFTMVGTPTAMHCIADIWLIGLGFVVVLSALATKLLRLYRVFNGIQITASLRKGLSNIDLLEQTTLSILVAVAILLVWTLVDPPKPTLMRVSSLSYYYTPCSRQTARAGRRYPCHGHGHDRNRFRLQRQRTFCQSDAHIHPGIQRWPTHMLTE